MPRRPKQAADDGLTLHTTFRIPRELHELLTKAAAEHGYGIGEEIRRRLEASFTGAPWTGDLEARQLFNAFATVIGFLASWRLTSPLNDPDAFATLESAINLLLAFVRPDGEPERLDPDEIEKFARMAAGAAIHTLPQEIALRAAGRMPLVRKKENRP